PGPLTRPLAGHKVRRTNGPASCPRGETPVTRGVPRSSPRRTCAGSIDGHPRPTGHSTLDSFRLFGEIVNMEATGPLHGLRVLDLPSVVMGPLCTQMLGDLGADIVVVERFGGDTNRVMGAGPHPQLSGISLNLMRNKRSVSLDLGSPAGAAAVREL